MNGSVRFHGLTPTHMPLEGLEQHRCLTENDKKRHAARAALAAHG